MQAWFDTPPGRYLQQWEQATFDEAVADLFGYHALQVGLPALETLCANRMPHRWLALEPGQDAGGRLPDLRAESHALPFEAASLDLVVLPHALELSADPHTTLREVERVLVPEGRVVISGLNPLSLWGLRQHRARLYRRVGMGALYLPETGEFIAYRRLRDWLRLLGFEVEVGRFGCWRPALTSQPWLDRFAWMDRAGERWWPFLGAAYFLVAVKRVRGARLLEAKWPRAATIAAAPVPLARRGPSVNTRNETP